MSYIGMQGPKWYFFSRFGHKQGIDFGHFGLTEGVVLALQSYLVVIFTVTVTVIVVVVVVVIVVVVVFVVVIVTINCRCRCRYE